MTIIDTIIIYLTIGAPFAVFHFIRCGGSFTVSTCFKASLAGLFWPPFAVDLSRSHLRPPRVNREFEKSAILDSATEKKLFTSARIIEDAFPAAERPHNIRVFRDVFDRYCGLTSAISLESASTNGTDVEFFAISGNPKQRLASKVIQRRNKLKLANHQKEARRDLLRFLRSVSSDSRVDRIIAREISYVAVLLYDVDLADLIQAETKANSIDRAGMRSEAATS